MCSVQRHDTEKTVAAAGLCFRCPLLYLSAGRGTAALQKSVVAELSAMLQRSFTTFCVYSLAIVIAPNQA